MPDIVNPLAVAADTYGYLKGIAQDRTARTAGTALAAGDMAGAQSTLLRAGMLDAGVGLQDREAARAASAQDMAWKTEDRDLATKDRTHKQVLERLTWLGQVTQGLKGIPDPAARKHAFDQQIRPVLIQMGFGEPDLAALDGSDFSDQTLAGWGAALGAEQSKWQVANGDDGSLYAIDPTAPGGPSIDNPLSFRTLREPDPTYRQQREAQTAATRALVPQRNASAAASSARAARTRAGPAPRGGSVGAGGLGGMSTADLLKLLPPGR